MTGVRPLSRKRKFSRPSLARTLPARAAPCDPALSNSLTDLAARIREEHEATSAFLRHGLEHAIAAGKLLIEAKAQLKHGEWLPWLCECCQVPERTASHYMRLARHTAEIGNVADLTVRGALAQLVGRGIVTGVAMTSHDARGLDYYETPTPAVHALLGAEKLHGPVWEPACGSGRIVRVLRAAGHRVVATDIEDYGCPDAASGMDFLQQKRAPEGVTTIVTNPPFMHANEFVRHALSLVPRVVMLLRLAFLEGQGRSDILDGGQLARVLPFRNRLSFSREGTELGSAIAFAWFC